MLHPFRVPRAVIGMMNPFCEYETEKKGIADAGSRHLGLGECIEDTGKMQ